MLCFRSRQARTQAKKQGLKKYLAAEPCVRGHVGLRAVRNNECLVCKKERRVNSPSDKEARKRAKRKSRGQVDVPNRPSLNVCECCCRFMEGPSEHEDHDHVTGYFRGWLCNRCNVGIGLLGDDIAGVQKALDYLTVTAKYNERVRNSVTTEVNR